MRAVIEFLKKWTLPTAIVGGAVIYFIFAGVPALGGVARVMSPVFDAVVPWWLFAILLVTFLKIDYHKLRLAWWHLWVCVAQVVMTLTVVACILYFHIGGNNLIMLECVLACIIGPCAAASAVVTAKLGGSLESMTTYTFISNVLTAVMIPLFFPLINRSVTMPFGQSFLLIMSKVCVVLVVPMALAWLIHRLLPAVQRWVVAIPDLGFYLWSCLLAIVSGITFRNIMNANTTWGFIVTIVCVSFVLTVIQFSVGRYIGHYFGSSVEAGQALGQKNTAFAIWVSSAYLHPLASVGPGCYIIWQNLVNSLELWEHGKEHAGMRN